MSAVSAVIKLAPVLTLEQLPKLAKRGRDVFAAGALRTRPGVEALVYVDHDEDRTIGRVHGFHTWPDTDGLWIFAAATIHEAPPWLKRGTRCSFDHRNLVVGEVDGLPVIRHALVEEVSLLHDLEPREPCARVVALTPLAERAARSGDVPLDDAAISRVLCRRFYPQTVTVR